MLCGNERRELDQVIPSLLISKTLIFFSTAKFIIGWKRKRAEVQRVCHNTKGGHGRTPKTGDWLVYYGTTLALKSPEFPLQLTILGGV